MPSNIPLDSTGQAKLAQLRAGNTSAVSQAFVDKPPQLPEDVKARFPSLVQWEAQFVEYMQQKIAQAIRSTQ